MVVQDIQDFLVQLVLVEVQEAMVTLVEILHLEALVLKVMAPPEQPQQ